MQSSLRYQSQTISLDNIKSEIAADNVECSGYGLSEVIILGTVAKTVNKKIVFLLKENEPGLIGPSSPSVWKESSNKPKQKQQGHRPEESSRSETTKYLLGLQDEGRHENP